MFGHLQSSLFQIWYDRHTCILFSQISQLIEMKVNMLPQPVGLLRFMLNSFDNNQYARENNSAKVAFLKNSFSVELPSDAFRTTVFLILV